MECNMGNFKKFLSESFVIEKGPLSTVELVFQQILDRVDHGHVDMEDDYIEFHIGKLIKKSNFDVSLHIRRANSDIVRLAKRKSDDQYVIVVDTREELPVRTEIDNFLAKNKKIAQGLRSELIDYIETKMDHDGEPELKTKDEEVDDDNTSANFEDRYQEMVQELKEKMQEYKEMVAELEEYMDTENEGQRNTAKLAMRQLASEEFGEDIEAFKKIARGIMSHDGSGVNTGFANNLSKENKKRLDSRLENLYDQKIKPLLNQ